MAHPIEFKLTPTDPHKELMRRLEAAPREHAEALLVAWDLLGTAHDQGLLDLAQGLMGGRDIIAKKLAEGVVKPESIAAIRNAIALGRILGSFDPDMLHRLSKNLVEPAHDKVAEEARRSQPQPPGAGKLDLADVTPEKTRSKPPGLWQLFKRIASEDGRRGLGYATETLTALGRALRAEK